MIAERGSRPLRALKLLSVLVILLSLFGKSWAQGPSGQPSSQPTTHPAMPTYAPSELPSELPSETPTTENTTCLVQVPCDFPSSVPSYSPYLAPTYSPNLSSRPSCSPSTLNPSTSSPSLSSPSAKPVTLAPIQSLKPNAPSKSDSSSSTTVVELRPSRPSFGIGIGSGVVIGAIVIYCCCCTQTFKKNVFDRCKPSKKYKPERIDSDEVIIVGRDTCNKTRDIVICDALSDLNARGLPPLQFLDKNNFDKARDVFLNKEGAIISSDSRPMFCSLVEMLDCSLCAKHSTELARYRLGCCLRQVRIQVLHRIKTVPPCIKLKLTIQWMPPRNYLFVGEKVKPLCNAVLVPTAAGVVRGVFVYSRDPETSYTVPAKSTTLGVQFIPDAEFYDKYEVAEARTIFCVQVLSPRQPEVLWEPAVLSRFIGEDGRKEYQHVYGKALSRDECASIANATSIEEGVFRYSVVHPATNQVHPIADIPKLNANEPYQLCVTFSPNNTFLLTDVLVVYILRNLPSMPQIVWDIGVRTAHYDTLKDHEEKEQALLRRQPILHTKEPIARLLCAIVVPAIQGTFSYSLPADHIFPAAGIYELATTFSPDVGGDAVNYCPVSVSLKIYVDDLKPWRHLTDCVFGDLIDGSRLYSAAFSKSEQPGAFSYLYKSIRKKATGASADGDDDGSTSTSLHNNNDDNPYVIAVPGGDGSEKFQWKHFGGRYITMPGAGVYELQAAFVPSTSTPAVARSATTPLLLGSNNNGGGGGGAGSRLVGISQNGKMTVCPRLPEVAWKCPVDCMYEEQILQSLCTARLAINPAASFVFPVGRFKYSFNPQDGATLLAAVPPPIQEMHNDNNDNNNGGDSFHRNRATNILKLTATFVPDLVCVDNFLESSVSVNIRVIPKITPTISWKDVGDVAVPGYSSSSSSTTTTTTAAAGTTAIRVYDLELKITDLACVAVCKEEEDGDVNNKTGMDGAISGSFELSRLAALLDPAAPTKQQREAAGGAAATVTGTDTDVLCVGLHRVEVKFTPFDTLRYASVCTVLILQVIPVTPTLVWMPLETISSVRLSHAMPSLQPPQRPGVVGSTTAGANNNNNHSSSSSSSNPLLLVDVAQKLGTEYCNAALHEQTLRRFGDDLHGSFLYSIRIFECKKTATLQTGADINLNKTTTTAATRIAITCTFTPSEACQRNYDVVTSDRVITVVAGAVVAGAVASLKAIKAKAIPRIDWVSNPNVLWFNETLRRPLHRYITEYKGNISYRVRKLLPGQEKRQQLQHTGGGAAAAVEPTWTLASIEKEIERIVCYKVGSDDKSTAAAAALSAVDPTLPVVQIIPPTPAAIGEKAKEEENETDEWQVALLDTTVFEPGLYELQAVFVATEIDSVESVSSTVPLVIQKLRPVVVWDEPEELYLFENEELKVSEVYSSAYATTVDGKSRIQGDFECSCPDGGWMNPDGVHQVMLRFTTTDPEFITTYGWNVAVRPMEIRTKIHPKVKWAVKNPLTLAYGMLINATLHLNGRVVHPVNLAGTFRYLVKFESTISTDLVGTAANTPGYYTEWTEVVAGTKLLAGVFQLKLQFFPIRFAGYHDVELLRTVQIHDFSIDANRRAQRRVPRGLDPLSVLNK